MEIYSIGVEGHSAAEFFEKLRTAGVTQVVDVRLHNASPDLGFAHRPDLEYFVRSICGADYQHAVDLAPTPDLRRAARAGIPWEDFERRFVGLLARRHVEQRYGPDSFKAPTAVVCKEYDAQRCHRRLVLEYLAKTSIPDLLVHHL